MNEWTAQRQKASTTLTSFFNTKRCTYYNNGCINKKGQPDLPSIVDFTTAYQSFVRLQLWDKVLKCDGCISVGQLPKQVGADVTQILLKYERVEHICTAQDSYILHPEDEVVKMRKVVNETAMVYIDDRKLRTSTKEYLIAMDVRIYSKVGSMLSCCK